MALSKAIINKAKFSIPSIEQVSIELLIDAFKTIKVDKKYDLDWDEEQFSAYLISYMNKKNLTRDFNLHINIEKKLLDEDRLPINKNNPKYLPRIDISIASWLFKENEKLQYYFEAKNLCENNWTKKSGAKVTAKYYLDRYISTGVENFRTGRYYNGAIIGYVLEGDITNIITKLNSELLTDKNTIQSIQILSFLKSFNDIYNSIHKTPKSIDCEIKHIFLKF